MCQVGFNSLPNKLNVIHMQRNWLMKALMSVETLAVHMLTETFQYISPIRFTFSSFKCSS